MAIDLTELSPDFRSLLDRLIEECKAEGVEIRPYFGIRSPFEQARLWRQSRSLEEIQAKIAELQSAGAPFLAYCVESVGPQSGPPVTSMLPGFSWHQWGEAVDCAWLVGGKLEWSVGKRVNGVNGYRIFAERAARLGLSPGGLRKSLKYWPHVQMRRAESPLDLISLVQIDEAMRERYAGLRLKPKPQHGSAEAPQPLLSVGIGELQQRAEAAETG